MSRMLSCLFFLIAIGFMLPSESFARGRRYASGPGDCPGGVCNLQQRAAINSTTKTKVVEKQKTNVTKSAAVAAPSPPGNQSASSAPTPIEPSKATSPPVANRSAVSVQSHTTSRANRSERHGRHRERRRQSSVMYRG